MSASFHFLAAVVPVKELKGCVILKRGSYCKIFLFYGLYYKRKKILTTFPSLIIPYKYYWLYLAQDLENKNASTLTHKVLQML